MIKLEKDMVVGWEPAIRGMRNPMNSWEKSDSIFGGKFSYGLRDDVSVSIGPNDYELMMKLAKGGPVHAKYRRMIEVYVDITAPLYWWKEMDTYKVGTVANSCSTMHKIHAKEFELDDFSHEKLDPKPNDNVICCGLEMFDDFSVLELTINMLNHNRKKFLESNNKKYWYNMIQLLPSSYNQKRTVMLSYEVLHNIYISRKNHKLDEWREFCQWIESLPYSEFITVEAKGEES